ncbi:MAG: hypothetical protein A3C84_01590 [Candidatus Ryanbacteria bacterium RIFCSPHIGHO2_02_FULL_48_12]|uniref:YdbS-like PH domain-containing protein n=1 Tax=Candidatus Ryanbacteria bacterium RIFCSPHIGHO2_01_FULL_48_27 TaxID=1802115 RepID=A0A1G2G8H0_9BACT|nr:MAG: hypothetical protein A2756_06325 [Candidatus Ryanbacteria bacterium RIFCSPHIGHO2_01_FULL_48_27]OGZ49175.1 MAG: hypothetical protein A3C84_01590 [Candidatus Ryanbacteria bacterium RIFCSPHIGHO2_02_FULL_48_12]
MKIVPLEQGEYVVLVLRKHWFIFFGQLSAFLMAFVVGAFVSSFKDFLYGTFDKTAVDMLVDLLFILYALVLVAGYFVSWVHTYYDIWLVTNRRIIDIKQRGLFDREISEFMISRVQDVTTEVPNMLATLLGFGTMTIQTAGERSFTVHDIPHLEEAKRLIIKCSKEEIALGHQ